MALKLRVSNEEQPWNAASPIEVTELGMDTLVSPLQPSNALLPIEVTELGMVTLFNLVKPYAKYAGILCTLSPILMVVMLRL